VRVALVIERFEPRGGVEQAAWRVAHGLADAGDEVHVIARAARATDAALRVHRVAVADLWQPWRVLAFSRAAARAAPRGAFDVVHSFSRTRHQDLFRAGGGSHADYLERSHRGLALAARRISPRHRVLLGLEQAVFADASQHLQCNSRMVRNALARRYAIAPERLSVVYNGVDLERFHPARREGDGARLRAELGGAAQPVWLFAGSGFARKGLETALDALARTRDGALWVAGADDPAPWRARAERLGVASRVRWLGARGDMEALLAAADALLLPTRYDAFANVCLEAAAAGLPVITSASNGAAEILEEGGLVLEDARDARGFAAALDALGDPAARRARGLAARAAAERFSWSAHLAALRSLYARIASR
jgi:UDP-glucose:(heptosyl)LPS alpha-1,3-glucosyltransferase